MQKLLSSKYTYIEYSMYYILCFICWNQCRKWPIRPSVNFIETNAHLLGAECRNPYRSVQTLSHPTSHAMFLLAPAALLSRNDVLEEFKQCRFISMWVLIVLLLIGGYVLLACMYIYFMIFSTKGETVRYPRVKQFAHFHYDHVEFDTIQVRLTWWLVQPQPLLTITKLEATISGGDHSF